MSDFCEDGGPFRITLRGARETVVETRADVVAVIDHVQAKDVDYVVVETPSGRRIRGEDVVRFWVRCREEVTR